jgi:hypothetical protein
VGNKFIGNVFATGDLSEEDTGYCVKGYLQNNEIRQMVRTHGQNEIKRGYLMCRNIRTLFNFDPTATDEEIYAASLQYVRKISGFNKPSKVNQEAFNRAIEEIAKVTKDLLDTLETSAEPRNREVEAERARIRSAKRFGTNN